MICVQQSPKPPCTVQIHNRQRRPVVIVSQVDAKEVRIDAKSPRKRIIFIRHGESEWNEVNSSVPMSRWQQYPVLFSYTGSEMFTSTVFDVV